MKPKKSKLHYLGTFGVIRYYECVACGTRYPCATGWSEAGQPLELLRLTSGPMCNGKEITDCPCTKEKQ